MTAAPPIDLMKSRRCIAAGFGLEDYPREFKDTPSENAFCLVAPIVRLRERAIFPAGTFFLARPLRSRTSVTVHTRFFAFLAITAPAQMKSNERGGRDLCQFIRAV